MRVDSNTSGHRQWFYFSMKNEKKCRVRLNIYRFKKLYSLFQRGMRPYVKSRKSGKGWKPGGDNVQYRYQRQRNEYGVKKEVKKSFVLSLSFTFEHENDEVFMAAGIPYSYTFLQKQLSTYKQQVDKKENLSFQVTILGRSMCGLDIPLITVQHKMCKLVHADKKKRFIIINARTHSGETSSSWTLDGFLLQLGQSDAVDSWLLSENICLKIAPMLNPDGVFIGNYRTGIVGDDFNRKFQSGKKEFYPQIFALKKLVRQCKSEGTVQLFFDLHGHSILKNSFIYGPSQDYSSKFTMSNLPIFLLHNSKYFRFSSCKFKTEKENAETARIYFQLKEDILTFTCQNSLGLYQNQYQTFQMLAGDWQAFGQAIVHSMIETFKNRDIHVPQTSPGKQKQKSPHKQHKQSSMKSNFNSKLQQKIGVDEPKLKMQTSKNNKKERAYFKIPSVHKNMSSNQHITDISYSYSQQIQREDQFLQPKQFSFNEKILRQESRDGKQPINVRRKSEVMKVPASNILQRIIGRNKLQSLQRKNTEEEKAWMCLGRSSTYDTSEALQRQILQIPKNQEESDNYQDDMEPIDQNFSDDYVSMNDLDSDGENLPEQEKNYLFQYIKSNQHRVQSNEEEEDVRRPSEKEEPISRTKEVGDAKISRFREIRFKSIEEIYETDPSKEVVRTNTKKPKLEPHKFKDNVSKSLIYKYNDLLSHSEFDDPSMIAFSQQKQLNERNHRRTQKDPFILFQRKDKLDKQ